MQLLCVICSSCCKRNSNTQQRNLILGYLSYGQLFNTGKRLYRLANEQQKPDAEREMGYQET